jgi:hypothetical protein
MIRRVAGSDEEVRDNEADETAIDRAVPFYSTVIDPSDTSGVVAVPCPPIST